MGLKSLVGKALGPPSLNEVLMVCRVIGDKPGTMIDVGAHYGSTAQPFLDRGWTVYAFEPDPKNRAILKSNCPELTVDPRAISETDGDEVTLFTSDVSTGISSLTPFHDSHVPSATVQTVRLDTYLRSHQVDQVDFLKTDIEGYDLFALHTFPWDRHHPKAVVCEYEDQKTTPLGHDVHDTAKFLVKQGYTVLVSEWHPIDQYGGGNHRWRRFMRYPTDVPADSWGNLIAVNPELISELERVGRRAVVQLRIREWVKRISHRSPKHGGSR